MKFPLSLSCSCSCSVAGKRDVRANFDRLVTNKITILHVTRFATNQNVIKFLLVLESLLNFGFLDFSF